MSKKISTKSGIVPSSMQVHTSDLKSFLNFGMLKSPLLHTLSKNFFAELRFLLAIIKEQNFSAVYFPDDGIMKSPC